MCKHTKPEDTASDIQTATSNGRPATASDVLRGRDPKDAAGNMSRLKDAGWSEAEARQEALIYREAAKIDPAAAEAARGRVEALGQKVREQSEKQNSDTDREAAVRIAESAELFRSGDGTAWATVELDGHGENLPVRSRRYKAWLALRFRAARGKSPSTDALSIAQTHAEAIAELKGEEHEVCVRVGSVGERVYVDLCDAEWRAIEVVRIRFVPSGLVRSFVGCRGRRTL